MYTLCVHFSCNLIDFVYLSVDSHHFVSDATPPGGSRNMQGRLWTALRKAVRKKVCTMQFCFPAPDFLVFFTRKNEQQDLDTIEHRASPEIISCIPESPPENRKLVRKPQPQNRHFRPLSKPPAPTPPATPCEPAMTTRAATCSTINQHWGRQRMVHALHCRAQH